MKISFKIPAIATLSGLVLCAGVLSAGGVASADKAAVGALPENDKSIEQSVGVIEDILPSWNFYKHIEYPVILTEYPEKLLPYIEELGRINAELNRDYEICRAFPNDEEEEYMIKFITSMSIEEFRDFVYEGYEEELEYSDWLNENTDVHYYSDISTKDSGTVGVIEYKGFNGVIKHGGGFWYFEGNNTGDNASDEDTSEPDTHYYPDDSDGTIAHSEHEYGVDEPHDFTENSTVGNAGVYRGDGWVYPCDYADDMASDISEIVIDYVPNADDMTYVREVKRNYDEQKTKYGQMLPTDYTDIPQEMTYGIMTDIDGLMVSHMKYVSSNGKTEIYTDREGEKVASLDYIDTQNAEIVFENGSIASEEDLISGTAMLVEYDMINETYPGNMHCTRIVILQQ